MTAMMELRNTKSINCSYIRQSNSGSSGGWNTAIAYALENKFDAIG